MIKFAIPGMYELRELNFTYLDLMRTHPEYFYPDIKVDICYGNPQFCIWDGGRIFYNDYKQASIEEVRDIIDLYNNTFNIPIRYVFTNTLLKEEDYYNRFCNLIMEAGNNYHNEVVLNDENLLNYLKNKFNNFNFISSTTKCLLDKDLVKQELNKDKFKLVCLDYNLNKNISFLESLSPEEKNKVELLVNAICAPGCTHRKKHYDLNSYSHLNYGKGYGMEYCAIRGGAVSNNTISTHITYDDIKNIYEPLGINYFKIEGRTWNNVDLLLTYCNYMVKPEYKMRF